MSQPTRNRTTGAATRTPRSKLAPTSAPAPMPAPTPSAPANPAPASAALTPDALARTLRAVAAELERDPALARRVADALASDAPPAAEAAQESDAASLPSRAEGKGLRVNRNFRPKLVTGASPDLGTGIPDPFTLYARLGEDGLRAALSELRLGTLRAIAREHGLDPKGSLSRQNDAEKLRSAILKAAKKSHK